MSYGITPCLSLAIERLKTAGSDGFARWVTRSPLPEGYVHHDSRWSEALTRQWLTWQEMFSLQQSSHLPNVYPDSTNHLPPLTFSHSSPSENYGGRLMQELGISLWQWLFDGQVRQSYDKSRSMAFGRHRPLRLRLEIRDPNLIPLPWEIMQPEAGKQAISLDPQILFSRTTSNVDPLAKQQSSDALNILLVLGENLQPKSVNSDKDSLSYYSSNATLQLETEVASLTAVIEQNASMPTPLNPAAAFVRVRVTSLIQPTPAKVIEALDSGIYNVFFYAGHGIPGPDGGLLFLRPQTTINGTELAQVLVRDRITLAVFNACWGAQPDQQGQQAIERSSMAEVLIHHGVPAVLAMRDSIADREALSFIQEFTKALTLRWPVDQAVRVARQQLLTLYKFNQPAWTLPILYMHPEFDGELIRPISESNTELPYLDNSANPHAPYPIAYLRFIDNDTENYVRRIYNEIMRIGRSPENDLVIENLSVSKQHAEIICRETTSSGGLRQYTYSLKDFSRFGTYVSSVKGWQQIYHQEVLLQSGTQLKFSPHGEILEFVIEGENESRK